MKILDTMRGALRRIAAARSNSATPNGASALGKTDRRTVALPSIFNSYAPRHEALPKPTPVNLRRFAETPVARRAINTVKDRIAGMRWRVQPKNGRALAELPEGQARLRLLADNLDSPNPHDSFRSLAEQVLEDIIVGGFGAIEVQLTAATDRPLVLWPVDGASISIRSDWDGQPSSIRYVQAVASLGMLSQANKRGSPANGQRPMANGFTRGIELRDDELSYIRLNPRT